MRIAIMQPYFLPYIGYFQLINSADLFVLYDDVNFIKQGWINRNKIHVQGKDQFFTLPLQNQSSNALISETQINLALALKWVTKFDKTIHQAHKKSTYFSQGQELLQWLESHLNQFDTIADLNAALIIFICEKLKISTQIVKASESTKNQSLKAQERVIDICENFHAKEYVNPIGGIELYSKEIFKENGLDLYFIKPSKSLSISMNSILELVLYYSYEEIADNLTKYELL